MTLYDCDVGKQCKIVAFETQDNDCKRQGVSRGEPLYQAFSSSSDSGRHADSFARCRGKEHYC